MLPIHGAMDDDDVEAAADALHAFGLRSGLRIGCRRAGALRRVREHRRRREGRDHAERHPGKLAHFVLLSVQVGQLPDFSRTRRRRGIPIIFIFARVVARGPGQGYLLRRMADAEPIIDELLLPRWHSGDRQAHDALMRAVYPIMRAMAQRELGSGNGRLTIRATELAHEAYLRLLEQRGAWKDRAHLLAIVARVIRRVLIDLVRERHAQKRGSEFEMVALDPGADHQHPQVDDALDLLSLDHALTLLERRDAIAAQVVELRYFSGLSTEEVAAVLGIGVATVVRHWQFGRAYLHRRLA